VSTLKFVDATYFLDVRWR